MPSNTRKFANATATSPIVDFTGPVIHETYTSTACTIEPTAKTTTSVTGIMHPKMATGNYLDSYVQINISEPLSANCSRHAECLSQIVPNPDISGLGVVAAFLVSAYLVLAMLLVAYWLAVLPKDLVRRVDRQLFFVRRTEPDERWRRIFEEIVLMFSDQQLLTGLGVLIAGYIQVLNASLSAYHWNSVVYLAWLSSTVHLMSLSVLRERLKRSKVSLAIRLCAILLVFVLLVAALWPTAMFPENPTMPVRCLWKARAYSTSEVSYFINTSVSYITLVGTFVWKLSQFSGRSREWIRYWGRASVECALEKAARQLLQTKHPTLWTRASYRALTTLYIVFVAHLELLESFMFTITLLTYTLVWGTLHLVIRDKDTYGSHVANNELDEAEKEMGFGQILPLLLLAQPALAALDTLKRTVASTEQGCRAKYSC
ncbi:hypothetical protein PG999_001652 [Apiospora kogelbergensis]|uniref:Uncharacterized protein n=1 Tax=Apiospora kogelbergensis TaxID=1337665 RepID=A0AAW0R5V9_9PEZI